LAHLAALDPNARATLLGQLVRIDFAQLAGLIAAARSSAQSAPDLSQIDAPDNVVRLPRTPEDRRRREEARQRGERLLAEGKVGLILVAGGQGTRLGALVPKGMLPIAPVSGATLFQLFFEQAAARARRAGRPLPYFLMTSPATDAPTREFLEQNGRFGFPSADLFLFQQGTMPAVDACSGRLLLEAPDRLALSPDGHGGMLAAFAQSRLLDEATRRGLEFLFYHQVDNPLTVVADPVFLGLHAEYAAEISTKVVAKTGPAEKMGVVVRDGRGTRIVEYSDLPPELAQATDERGGLKFWAGSTAIHVFSTAFLRRLVESRVDLPFHIARKIVPCLDARGAFTQPAEPNAWKFERFIFDVMPWAERALVMEVDRATEFNPVKNASGVNSPDDVRRSLSALHAGWLRGAGLDLSPEIEVEISPLWALDAEEVHEKIRRLDSPPRPAAGRLRLA